MSGDVRPNKISQITGVKVRKLGGRYFNLVFALLVALSVFHLYVAATIPLPALQMRSIHLMFLLVITFLLYPLSSKDKDKPTIVDWICISLAILACVNTYLYYYVAYERMGEATLIDILLGGILIFLVLEATRRVLGLILPLIAIIFIVYFFFGHLIPDPLLTHAEFSLWDFIEYQYLSTEGLWGIPLGASATFIAVFLIFAAFMVESGAGSFFMKLSEAIAGSSPGGPAKVAVVSSAFFGMLSGSAVSNVVTTGSITIPLMKKIGYRPTTAAAIEAVSSTGGQIMPPLMGAAAFIMAGFLGVPYLQVCIAAFLPAVFYFLSEYMMVHFEAKKAGLTGLPKEALPKISEVLKEGGHLLIPPLILVITLVMGFTEMRVALYSTIAVMLVSILRKSTLMTPKKVFNALKNGAFSMIQVGLACATAGIIVGVLTQTGLALKFSFLLTQLSGGNVYLLAILGMLGTIILGMGITTSAAYIIVALLVAPAIITLGIPEITAHMFVLYFAAISTITPPVALAAYAAAGVANTDPLRSGVEAVRIGIAGFIVPFIFLFRPELNILPNPNPMSILATMFTTVFILLLFSMALVGYGFRKLNTFERCIAILSGALMVIVSEPLLIAGFGLGITLTIFQFLTKNRGIREPTDLKFN